MEAEVCVPQDTLCPNFYLQMFTEIIRWSGTRPLASATLSILKHSKTPLRYNVMGLYRGDPVVLDLYDWPLHSLQQLINGVDVGMDKFKALDLGLRGI